MPASTASSVAREPDEPDAPLRIGRYEALRKIGTGGMANVYLGRAQGLAGFERLVAIKCCHPHLRDDEHFARMFLDEARLAARIHHPNVVATLDVGEDLRRLFLVMEYIEGGRLVDLMREMSHAGTTVPIDIALRIMVDALLGLHAAHELRGAAGTRLDLVHRDVSPQNVLVGTDGVARITDFGIARASDTSHSTRDGARMGKVAYMAPEQVMGAAVSRRTDVFAAGVVLWELLSGHRLFLQSNEIATAQRVASGPIEPPSAKVPGLPAALDAATLHALARDPAQRFPTALAFAEALEGAGVTLASNRAVGAFVEQTLAATLAERSAWASAPGAEEPPTRSEMPTLPEHMPAPRTPRRRWLGAAAALLVGLGVTVVALRGHGTRPTPAREAHRAVPPARAPEATAPPREHAVTAPVARPLAPPPPTPVEPPAAVHAERPAHRASRASHARRRTHAVFNPGAI